ncbi:MAG: DUF4231 domain-containing protein [Saprospiraceae bacterium]
MLEIPKQAPDTPTPTDYLRDRIDDQIGWYEMKSKRNKQWYHLSRTLTILGGALIPLCVGYSDSWNWLKYLAGALGVVIAITEGILGLKKFKDNWFTYRSAAEALRREKQFYLHRVGDYSDPAVAFPNFVQRAEQIMSSENSSWIVYRGNDKDTSPASK